MGLLDGIGEGFSVALDPVNLLYVFLGARGPGVTTTQTWALRHVARMFVQLAVPLALVLAFVPGDFWIRGMSHELM